MTDLLRVVSRGAARRCSRCTKLRRDALVSGFQRGLLTGSIFIAATAVIALRAANTHGEPSEAIAQAQPEPAS